MTRQVHEQQQLGASCDICSAPVHDAHLCDSDLDRLARIIGDYPSLLHEASNLATGQTRVTRTNRTVPIPDQELAELDEEYHHRMNAIPARLRSRDGRMALPSTRPVVNLDARELLADAYDTIRGQITDLRDQAGTEPHGWSDAIAWLLRNLDTIRRHPSAASIFDELTYMHGRLERAIDRTQERIYAGPCRATLDNNTCCARDLYLHPAAGEIRCDGYRSDLAGCGSIHTIAERQEWLLREINGAVLPLELWRTALPRLFPELTWPTRSTWWRWEQNGRITREAATDIGTPLYRGGELISLVVSEQPRIIGNASKKRRCA